MPTHRKTEYHLTAVLANGREVLLYTHRDLSKVAHRHKTCAIGTCVPRTTTLIGVKCCVTLSSGVYCEDWLKEYEVRFPRNETSGPAPVL